MPMNHCSYCQKKLLRNLTFCEILGLSKKLPQICTDCFSLFHFLEKQGSCHTCQKKVKPMIVYCEDCLEWKKQYPEYDFCHQAYFAYDSSFKEWLKRYKFLGDIRLAGTFANQWQQLHQTFTGYLFCPIPLSKERLNERGFNQVSEMLRVAKVPYQCLLTRTKHLMPQARKSKQERLDSSQPFELNVASSVLEKKQILLIDDVYTTGRTFFHAAACLLPYQPEKIRTFSLARSMDEKQM